MQYISLQEIYSLIPQNIIVLFYKKTTKQIKTKFGSWALKIPDKTERQIDVLMALDAY